VRLTGDVEREQRDGLRHIVVDADPPKPEERVCQTFCGT
jgi:hypothetical protein